MVAIHTPTFTPRSSQPPTSPCRPAAAPHRPAVPSRRLLRLFLHAGAAAFSSAGTPPRVTRPPNPHRPAEPSHGASFSARAPLPPPPPQGRCWNLLLHGDAASSAGAPPPASSSAHASSPAASSVWATPSEGPHRHRHPLSSLLRRRSGSSALFPASSVAYPVPEWQRSCMLQLQLHVQSMLMVE
ncbi:hypothetical protein U9M48_018255 [Paspalum notatum var. saurae]|uniref:Uncharacterized protein n=1 Tax=Paspalum notatum var. saurae TaxID=547442 RepID=A0AAQ3T941_PASNO